MCAAHQPQRIGWKRDSRVSRAVRVMLAAAAGLRHSRAPCAAGMMMGHPCSGGHRFSGEPAGRPCGLEIETAGDAVDVQHFAGEKKAGANFALHRFEIHFA